MSPLRIPILAFFFLLLFRPVRAAEPLPRSTPEAQGVDSRRLLEFVEAVDRIDTLHSFMVVRHGRVIAEGWWAPEAPDKPHVLWSLSKSFTATAVGLAVDEGRLGLEDPVLKFFPAEAPADPPANLRSMRVRDLLTMSCGHDREPKISNHAPVVREFLAHPVPHVPGTHFQYNSYGSYMLSAIVTRVTGQTVLEFLKPRLFGPLGIGNPVWEASPEGPSLGGYGLFLCTEDVAKFGQLYLQKGVWKGRRLLSEKWVGEATSRQVGNAEGGHVRNGEDWAQGYGFQFWRCTHGAFRGDGRAGQLCVVMPEQDAVVAVTAEASAFPQEMEAIWALLPALGGMPLPEDPAAVAELRARVGRLVAHPARR